MVAVIASKPKIQSKFSIKHKVPGGSSTSMVYPTSLISRSKVLLLTYSCSPNRGSEPGLGWNWAVESAKNFDTWVISSEGEFANEIRCYLKDKGEISSLHFIFVDNCALARVYAYVWPVLREFKASATVFLNTAYMDSVEPFPFDRWGITYQHQLPAEHYRPLTLKECREMVADGLVELGSHTHTHRDFRSKPEKLVQDTQISIDMLRKRFGLENVSFAFPGGRRYSGHSGEEMMSAVKKLPVTCALTTDGVPIYWRSDPFGWGRFNVYQWDTAATLRAKLKGCYGWAPKLQERYSLAYRSKPIQHRTSVKAIKKWRLK